MELNPHTILTTTNSDKLDLPVPGVPVTRIFGFVRVVVIVQNLADIDYLPVQNAIVDICPRINLILSCHSRYEESIPAIACYILYFLLLLCM